MYLAQDEADVNMRDKYGLRPLQYAMYWLVVYHSDTANDLLLCSQSY